MYTKPLINFLHVKITRKKTDKLNKNLNKILPKFKMCKNTKGHQAAPSKQGRIQHHNF